MNSSGASLFASTLSLIALLAGCASSTSEDRGHVVIGQGSPADRQVIENSNRQIFQTEQAGIPSPTVEPTAAAAPSSAPPAPAAPQPQ